MKSLASITACLVLGGALTLSGQSRLSRAASAGDLAAVKKCIDVWGLGVDDLDDWGWTPLMWSVYFGNLTMADYLISKGANPNTLSTVNHMRVPKGSTNLMIAAIYGRDEIAQHLLQAGANPSLINSEKISALGYAKQYEQASFAEVIEKWTAAHSK